MFKKAHIAVLAILTTAAGLVPAAFSQIENARASIAQKDHLEALRILSGISHEAAGPDTYLLPRHRIMALNPPNLRPSQDQTGE
jgi:hypothetical protein